MKSDIFIMQDALPMRCRPGFSVLGLMVLCCKRPAAASRLRRRAVRPRKPSRPIRRQIARPLTAQAVLEKMVAAYHSARTYEDFATAELWEEGTSEPRRADFKVAFQRPDKLRMEFYQGRIVCDGKKWLAFCKDIPGQAALREAPKN